MSALPDNPLGRFALNTLRSAGVDVSRVVLRDGRIGIYFTELAVRPRGTEVVYDREYSAFASTNPDDFDWESLNSIEYLHVSGITPALKPNGGALFERAMLEAGKRNVKVSFDLNFRTYLWAPKAARRYLEGLPLSPDVAIASERDVDLIWPQQSELSPDRKAGVISEILGSRVTVFTRGARGAGCRLEDKWIEVPSYEAEALDPIGRGDAFAGGFLSRLIADDPIRDALDFGCASAAIAQTYLGDVSMATYEIVRRVMQGEIFHIRR
jgi:2-dehydro-3-deoxygluconokinase